MRLTWICMLTIMDKDFKVLFLFIKLLRIINVFSELNCGIIFCNLIFEIEKREE